MIHQLEADSVDLQYGSRKILSSVYIKLETGRITGLLGRNGTGKTSLIHILYGSLRGTHQCLHFDGNHITQPYLQKDLISFLPQYNFIPKHLSLKRVFEDYRADYGAFERQFTGFAGKYHSAVKTLSGGQLRLVELFIVLAGRAKFVLLDEPFSHLTPVLAEQLALLISEKAQTKGILITDHLYKQVVDLADDLYLLSDGNMRKIQHQDELGFYGYLKRSEDSLY